LWGYGKWLILIYIARTIALFTVECISTGAYFSKIIILTIIVMRSLHQLKRK
jgi:hypothetical protein